MTPKTDDIPAGYRAYNGHVFTPAEAARYNARNRDVERNLGFPAGLERALNARHKTFCMITGCND
jgi:hypothetical protein